MTNIFQYTVLHNIVIKFANKGNYFDENNINRAVVWERFEWQANIHLLH
jgi:hypothetical protein